MTDAYYAASATTDHGSGTAAVPNGQPFHSNQRFDAPVQEVEQEDDGQISCLCGYDQDDGNTVACDKCNRWQHIECYYPDLEGPLPESLQHFCIECNPGPIHNSSARELQQQRKAQQPSAINGTKRAPAKSHKKKVKAETTLAHTNGWPLDKKRHDRNSASPRDQQPPPAKRPKTSHRNSDPSAATTGKGHSRKRNASNVNGDRGLSQSPETHIPLYTPEFLQAYTNEAWSVTHANLHNDISVTNELADWLRQPDDHFRSTHNVDKGEVLMRWDGELDDIPGKAQLEIRDMHDESVIIDGQHPAWKIVTVQEPVANGGYIGELKGHVGFRDQYLQDPANRWPSLRHPEPFVFFHPKLPLYIDARREGTELRYVRRSCRPNAKLHILVTDGTDYRFCFMATALIEPGQEISVCWDTVDAVPGKQDLTSMSPSETGQFRTWASTVMANCGPCACSLPSGQICGFAQLDRRGVSVPYEEETQPIKTIKSRKRKVGQHVSPLNTHALNSRSGSEVRRGDADDEPVDSRSVSGSGRGSASRDITPNTHYSNNGSLSTMPELSERERKKLAKEEEMFRRQDEQRTGKQGKKKRSSAGSNLNTPSATTSRQLGFPPINSKYADASTARPSDLPSAKGVNGKRPLQKPSSTKRAKTAVRPRPTYVDSASQCDLDDDEDARKASAITAPRPKVRFISTSQRLLDRCARNNAVHAGKPRSPSIVPAVEETVTKLEVQIFEPEPQIEPKWSPDVAMEDAPLEQEAVDTADAADINMSTPADDPLPTSSPHLMTEPSSWPPKFTPQPTTEEPSRKSIDMHIDMPPPPINQPDLTSEATGIDTIIAGSMAVQSPLGLLVPPISALPASVKESVSQTPARKKLSLSDYTRRNKTKDTRDPSELNSNNKLERERDSSPASVTSGPIAPPAQPSSSAEAGLDHAIAVAEAGSSSTPLANVGGGVEGGREEEEDVKMEDAPPPAPTTAAVSSEVTT